MDFNPVSLILFILVFVPGYIFIHILDYHLVKGEKSQFEKTVQGILASTIIWVIFLFIPIFPFIDIKRKLVINFIFEVFVDNKAIDKGSLSSIINAGLFLYSLVLIVSAIAGNIWGWVRRRRRIDDYFRFFTGRDRYRTVSLRFFTEYFGSTIMVTNAEGKKYAGILAGAPDDSDDAIILSKPLVLEKNKFIRMGAVSILLYLKYITRIEVIKPFIGGKQ
jgi:hypothetical protein